MKPIRIDFMKNEVVMTRAFAESASDPHSREYLVLQDVLNTYPNIHVKRHTIKKNPNKECYKGLTYEYMRKYISLHETGEELEAVMAEFDEMLLIAECHSKSRRYPPIKNWFLNKYEEVKMFGVQPEVQDEERAVIASVPQTESSEDVENIA